MSGEPRRPPPPAAPPGKAAGRTVLICAALPIELGAAVRRGRPRLGGFAAAWGPRPGEPVPVAYAALGIGRAACERTLGALCEQLQPCAVAMVGLAGGCQPGLGTGALVLGTLLVCDPATGPGGAPLAGRGPLAPDPLTLAAVRRAARAARRPLVEGTIASTAVIATPSAKASLGRHLGAEACDMESYWAARLVLGRGLPFVAVRAVFDPLGMRLPPVPPDGLGRALLRRPGLALGLPGLALRLWRCRRALAPLVRALPAALAGPPAPGPAPQ
ncbi:MAG: hypothetical protein KatS3mg102_0750 [Planctomycetota bacterium]|nr:MAG: hypothetical protein KatS3mg102_0750 [Planctomycetota bacterium]